MCVTSSPYVSPQLDVAARLNTNECPHPLPEGFFNELAEAVEDLPLNRYPDGQMTRLREELAARHGHTVEGTWTANGSNEVLTELLLAYGGPGRTAVVFEPTYLLHSRLSWLTHTATRPTQLEHRSRSTTPRSTRRSRLDPDVVFVCSPNNPTGNAQPLEAVTSIAERTNALVIVDEAYIEFGGESALKLVADHPNVAVVRTFSKAFALAGARSATCSRAPRSSATCSGCGSRTTCRRSPRPPGSWRSATRPRPCRCWTRSARSATASCASSAKCRA